MSDRKYIKKSDLVGKEFTIDKVWGYSYQKFDEASNKMLREDRWVDGYSKAWDVVTNEGQVELSDYQIANLLAKCYEPKEDRAGLVGLRFKMTSNGASGKDVRYYINRVYGPATEAPRQSNPRKDVAITDISDDPVDLSAIPF